MAITAIKRGTPPMDRKYECECMNCSSILQFLRSDVKLESSPRNESYYRFKCPVCNRDLYIDTDAVKEVKD